MDQKLKNNRRTSSHLFMLRFWFEWLDKGRIEWRGQVEHVMSGKILYFRSWSALVSYLEETLAVLDQDCGSTDNALTNVQTSAHSKDQDNQPSIGNKVGNKE